MSLLIDLLAATLLAGNLLLAWRFGLVSRLIALVGVFAAVGAATFFGNAVLRFVHGGGQPNDLYVDAWTYVAIFGAVVVMVETLLFLYSDRIKHVMTLIFDRTVALAVGAVAALAEITVVCLVGLAVGSAAAADAGQLPPDRAQTSDAVQRSLVGGHLGPAESALRVVFGPVLPGDLSSHLAEAATR